MKLNYLIKVWIENRRRRECGRGEIMKGEDLMMRKSIGRGEDSLVERGKRCRPTLIIIIIIIIIHL